MNYYSTIQSLFIVCTVILFTACEGNYTHTYRVTNNSTTTFAFLQPNYNYVTTDSINYYDSLVVDTIFLEPNQSKIISTMDDFGNMPRDEEKCIYHFTGDTVYQFTNDSLVASFLGTDMNWIITNYDKNKGQECTTTITNSIINSTGF